MPRPRTDVFHAMFSVSLHRSGRPLSPETPVAAGPLQCGQFSACAVVSDITMAKASRKSLMIVILPDIIVAVVQSFKTQSASLHAGFIFVPPLVW